MSTKHTVTLPDGTTATRTSKSRLYAHAIAVGPHEAEAYAAKVRAGIARTQARIAEMEAAIANPVLVLRSRGFSPSATKSYNTHDASLKGLSQKSWHASADGEVEDRINWAGRGEGAIMPARDYLVKSTQREIDEYQKPRLADQEKLLADIEAGTADLGGWYVASWSSRRDLAEKAANSTRGYHEVIDRPVVVLDAQQETK